GKACPAWRRRRSWKGTSEREHRPTAVWSLLALDRERDGGAHLGVELRHDLVAAGRQQLGRVGAAGSAAAVPRDVEGVLDPRAERGDVVLPRAALARVRRPHGLTVGDDVQL